MERIVHDLRVADVNTLAKFLVSIAGPLADLYQYFTSGNDPDPEHEKLLAMRLVRAASDARAEREIQGP